MLDGWEKLLRGFNQTDFNSFNWFYYYLCTFQSLYSITLFTSLSLCQTVGTNGVPCSLFLVKQRNYFFSCVRTSLARGKRFYKIYMHVHSTTFCTHARHACTGPNSSSSSICMPKTSAVKRNFNFLRHLANCGSVCTAIYLIIMLHRFLSLCLITSTTYIPVCSLNMHL